MNCLVLQPARQTLTYSGFLGQDRTPLQSDSIDEFRGGASDHVSVVESLRRIQRAWRTGTGDAIPDAIAVRSFFGGEVFPKPAVVDPETVSLLETLVLFAPLHIPVVMSLIEGCTEVFPTVPVVLVFETSFFAGLPRRESYYGLDPAVTEQLKLRRFGFHGLYHEAACGEVGRSSRGRGGSRAARIVSICLETRPEVAAVIGRRPVMVTSGATPLEGLPGHRTCGELDPSIVLTLSNELGWGPEKINEVLTQESGLFGLLEGHPGNLASVFKSPNDEATRLAREVIQYRLLLACGSAVAAMGGIDAIVFSGQYRNLGRILGPRLAGRLKPRIPAGSPEVGWSIFEESIDRLVADRATAALLQRGAAARV